MSALRKRCGNAKSKVALVKDHDADDFKEPVKKKIRFGVSTTEEVEASKKPVEVKNTNKSTMWPVRVFGSWLSEHNERPEEKCP